MLRSIWVYLVIILSLSLSGCGNRIVDKQQVNKEEKIIIKFSHVVEENTPKGLAAIRFARLISERSKGSIEVQIFPDSQLFKDGEEFEAIRRGDVQMIAPATSKVSQLFPQWQIWDLPYLFSDLEGVHQIMDGSLGKRLMEQLKEKNLYGLAMWDNGFKHLTNNKHPIIQPSDFKGLKFRVMSPGILQEQFNYFEAKAIFLPFNDVYDALNEGQVEGQENTISNIYTKKFSQVQKYLTLSQHGFLGYAVIINLEFWNQLPDNARELIENTMEEVTFWERDIARELNKQQLEEIKKLNSVSIYSLDEEERRKWQGQFRFAYTKFEKENGSEFLNEVKKWNEGQEIK
ncbi:C4-dicarboxylate ABC transporter [Desulfosporosinus sp. HMP52]|uniref:DctP family TRAP transporter solute-binding subunit n=1 Tax=Desulfosporosinus sp. HMP52 TaxID=1487923 RepID=UPI00051F8932|nr:DctP family TRAP transporter solute-binding subunit [Desulfosporosinus sp. HMP52]KGK82211.1 C4-dicarboxylate ABC transporter [Desulfosporosinus sp. HMP52]